MCESRHCKFASESLIHERSVACTSAKQGDKRESWRASKNISVFFWRAHAHIDNASLRQEVVFQGGHAQEPAEVVELCAAFFQEAIQMPC